MRNSRFLPSDGPQVRRVFQRCLYELDDQPSVMLTMDAASGATVICVRTLSTRVLSKHARLRSPRYENSSCSIEWRSLSATYCFPTTVTVGRASGNDRLLKDATQRKRKSTLPPLAIRDYWRNSAGLSRRNTRERRAKKAQQPERLPLDLCGSCRGAIDQPPFE